jgi:hypothetical protein
MGEGTFFQGDLMHETTPQLAETLKFQDNPKRDERTPGRKLTKDDISSTAVLIRGCTTQSCCEPPNMTGVDN